MLKEATKALEKVTKDNVNTMKSYAKPPSAVDIVMQGVIIAFNEQAQVKLKPKEPGSMEKVADYWEYAKKSILNSKLTDRLKEYNEDKILSIPQKNINDLKLLIVREEFDPKFIKSVSEAACNISIWVKAVAETYGALLIVEPKRKELGEAEEKLAEAERVLGEKQAVLKGVIDLLNELQADYDQAASEKQQLEDKVKKC